MPGKQTTEERKKAERLAKLEAWKAKQTAEMQKKQRELEASGGTRGILEQMDRRAAESMASETQTQVEPPAQENENEAETPAPYPGKFDPKAIAKKATGQQSGLKALGNDVAVPASKLNLSVPVVKSVSDRPTDKDRSKHHISAQGMGIGSYED